MKHQLSDQQSDGGVVERLFAEWQLEHRDLLRVIDGLRRWMYDVNQLGIPRFGETADQLLMLRDRLVHHFGREDELGRRLFEAEPHAEVEVQALCRQADRDHERLLKRLDGLSERLRLIDPPFASWQRAVDEVELLVDDLEEHEEQEAESVRRWMHKRGGT